VPGVGSAQRVVGRRAGRGADVAARRLGPLGVREPQPHCVWCAGRRAAMPAWLVAAGLLSRPLVPHDWRRCTECACGDARSCDGAGLLLSRRASTGLAWCSGHAGLSLCALCMAGGGAAAATEGCPAHARAGASRRAGYDSATLARPATPRTACQGASRCLDKAWRSDMTRPSVRGSEGRAPPTACSPPCSSASLPSTPSSPGP
jgi:hypothetical protein